MESSNLTVSNALKASRRRRIGSRNATVRNAIRAFNYGEIDRTAKDPLLKWMETPEWKQAKRDTRSGDMIAKMEKLLTGSRLVRFKSDFDAHLKRGYKRLDRGMSFNFRDAELEKIFGDARKEFERMPSEKVALSSPRLEGDWVKVKTALVREFKSQFQEGKWAHLQTTAPLRQIVERDGAKIATFYTPSGQTSKIMAALRTLQGKMDEWKRKGKTQGRNEFLKPYIKAAWEEINRLSPIADPKSEARRRSDEHAARKSHKDAQRRGAAYVKGMGDWYDRLDRRGGYSGD